jgi:beta-lactamase class A
MAFRRKRGLLEQEIKKRGSTPARSVLVAIAAFLLGGLAAYFLFHFTATADNTVGGYPVRLDSNGYISPLLYVADSGTPSSWLDPLQSKIAQEIQTDQQQGLASDIGVYFRDFNNGGWTGVNQNDQFAPASLLKVPNMIAVLKAAEANPDILNNEILYDGSFNDNTLEDIKPLKQIEAGKTYTVNTLLQFMVQYSDNNANELLINEIGQPAISDVYSDLDVPYEETSTSDFMSPEQYATFFRVLYSSTYLSPDLSTKALELLSNADFPEGIEAGVPADVVVAQKFGERNFLAADGSSTGEELHNCGIVYNPEHPYLLCIMTKGSDFVKLENVIHDMSALVWQEVDSSSYHPQED